jgi:hypothetical protein
MQDGPGNQGFGQGRMFQNLPPQIQDMLKQFMQNRGGQGDGMQGGPGMQDFGQGRTLQNLPPQIQELLKQFMQGQGGQQVLPQTPITPGTQG